MARTVHRRADCRLCGGTDLTPVLHLAPTPPANAFVPADRLDQVQETYPLDLYFCEDCGHVQLRDVVDPQLLFGDYPYVSGTSPVFVKHFEDYARRIVERFRPEAGDLALDIGSNDGTLLDFFKGHGPTVLGIDPAQAIAAQARADGIETESGFFTIEFARRVRAERGPAKVITANNVFAHADDLSGITDGIKHLLADDGVFVFEVSYLVDVFEQTLFDTIYHEHLAYHTVKPLVPFFAAHGLEMFAAERIDSHGGSLRGYVQQASGPWTADGSVGALIGIEAGLGLDKAATLKAFSAKIDAVRDKLVAMLAELRAAGRSVAGFGAPAKATTLMYHFGLDARALDFIVDDNPLKQGLYSPGLHIPVLHSQALYDKKPDATVILAWNFAKPIIANHHAYLAQGSTFIVPLPEPEIYTSDD